MGEFMRGRYKLLLIIIISFLLVFFIYTNFYHSKSIYVAIGSNLNNGTTTYNYMEYIIEMKKGVKHMVIAGSNGLQLIEIQLGKEITVKDKEKYNKD